MKDLLVSIMAVIMVLISVVCLAAAAVAGAVTYLLIIAVYCVLYVIGAMSVVVVSLFVWWKSLINRMIDL